MNAVLACINPEYTATDQQGASIQQYLKAYEQKHVIRQVETAT